jgi:hypothetical protein
LSLSYTKAKYEETDIILLFDQVVEVNVKVEEPGKNNVHNNAFYAEEKLLKSELEAMRDCDPLSARHWIVSFFFLHFHPKQRKKMKEKVSEVTFIFFLMICPLLLKL